MLRSDMKWEWSKLCDKSVDAAWQAVMSSRFNILQSLYVVLGGVV